MNVNVGALAGSALTFLLFCAVGGFVIGYVLPADAKQEEAPYVPQVIPVPQDHAWCYVLVNDQRGIGNINILSCIPKE